MWGPVAGGRRAVDSGLTSVTIVGRRTWPVLPTGGYSVDPMATATITWRDAQEMPEDGRRYEAVEGELYVTAAPSARHQEISVTLGALLHELLVQGGHGRLFHAPGVEFPVTEEGVQPDLVFVSTERRGIIADDWIRGAPDLVVEILSPSTEDRDRGVKRNLYRRQGVAEYWIVDPDDEAIEVWRFEQSEAESGVSHERFTDVLPVQVGGDRVGAIELDDVFVRRV